MVPGSTCIGVKQLPAPSRLPQQLYLLLLQLLPRRPLQSIQVHPYLVLLHALLVQPPLLLQRLLCSTTTYLAKLASTYNLEPN